MSSQCEPHKTMKAVVCIVIALYVIIIAWNVCEIRHAQNIDPNDPNF